MRDAATSWPWPNENGQLKQAIEQGGSARPIKGGVAQPGEGFDCVVGRGRNVAQKCSLVGHGSGQVVVAEVQGGRVDRGGLRPGYPSDKPCRSNLSGSLQGSIGIGADTQGTAAAGGPVFQRTDKRTRLTQPAVRICTHAFTALTLLHGRRICWTLRGKPLSDMKAPLPNVERPHGRWIGRVAVALALIGALGLLLALQRVVSQSTDRAVLRRAALLKDADAQWRCRLLSALPDRRLCMVELAVVPAPE